MNKGIFIGRVGGDAELKTTSSGKAVASFSMAIDNGKDREGQKRQPSWIKATLWEKRAESLAQYITKGKLVYVEGPVSIETWVDKGDGSAKGKLCVTVREFEFCGGSEKREEQAEAQPQASDSSTIDDSVDIPF